MVGALKLVLEQFITVETCGVEIGCLKIFTSDIASVGLLKCVYILLSTCYKPPSGCLKLRLSERYGLITGNFNVMSFY